VVTSLMLADVRLGSAPDAPLTVDAVDEGFVFIAPFGDGGGIARSRGIGGDHCQTMSR
jgi:hypothetical protein